MKKQPLGLKPKFAHDGDCTRLRVGQILQAMLRYNEANKPIPDGWLTELKLIMPLSYGDNG